MAATVAAAAVPAVFDVPEDGTLYYDYLVGFPVGVMMSMELQPDADDLEEDDAAEFKFTVTKVGADRWTGVPRYLGAEIDTITLLEYVKEMMEGEDEIKVSQCENERLRWLVSVLSGARKRPQEEGGGQDGGPQEEGGEQDGEHGSKDGGEEGGGQGAVCRACWPRAHEVAPKHVYGPAPSLAFGPSRTPRQGLAYWVQAAEQEQHGTGGSR